METLKVKRLDLEAKLPTRSHDIDAGLDLYANETVFIPLNGTAKVKTGIAVNITPGFVGKIEDRSSMSLKGLRTGGGVVDAGYNGEICIVLHNVSNKEEFSVGIYERGVTIKKGDKIAQLLTYSVSLPEVVEVNELEKTERGSLGFGSSGIR